MMDFLYSYHVPNRTLGKGRNIFYQYHVPNGTDCNTHYQLHPVSLNLLPFPLVYSSASRNFARY